MAAPAELLRQDTPDHGEPARRAAVQHFLGTGEYDPKFAAWSGNIIERESGSRITGSALEARAAARQSHHAGYEKGCHSR